ncbi:hypothetical protein [Herbiconiux sp. L3-i23]|uniref:hypothetical protein n=1 Tax=Herbiconiux sp. L3-i23 TaxID=2905871 RepID=UPI002044EA0E|nr:hypothetical protein [Herbiconiux sp. L3-i23]BDI24186.1 hypothetical protein L3i23_29620 [Herbiconiux sp. L3-i23]
MSDDSARFRARYWPVPLLRAAIAAVAAIVVTFSSDHSPVFGLAVFGLFACAHGIALASTSRLGRRSTIGTILTVVQGVVSFAFGLAAVLAFAQAAPLASLAVLVVLWAVATGGLELAIGLRKADHGPASRDHLVVGVATLLLGGVYLLGRDDAIFLVGSFGAYAAIVAVYLGIAAFTLKWDTASEKSGSAVGS